ncbi:hypothetical protein EB001_19305, partial [bacterium]|nr:hypothetical protein [bacterium]
MADDGINTNAGLVKVTGSAGSLSFSEMGKYDLTVKEIVLGESLLNPGLQTAITFQSYIYNNKNLDQLKNTNLSMTLRSELAGAMTFNQKIYRLDNREFMPINVGNTEEFTIHACDQTLLNDAKSLVSKSWKCETPDTIVEFALRSCAGAQNIEVDSAQPARDYVAENIHPFQVISQQANVALDGGDPSFLHFMTFEEGGKHYFKSIRKLCQSGSVYKTYKHYETGVLGNHDYNRNRDAAISFSFPCDFDLLSDLLNGVDENGQNINSLTTVNPMNMATQLLGGLGLGGIGGMGGLASGSCGVGSGNPKQSVTNKGTNKTGCETDVEKHLLKRQARMALLEKDKIALRITVPWDPRLHVGKLIGLEWKNKKNGSMVYGSGTYLVASMMHKIQFGGFAVTTMDCVSQTAGGG